MDTLYDIEVIELAKGLGVAELFPFDSLGTDRHEQETGTGRLYRRLTEEPIAYAGPMRQSQIRAQLR